MRAMEFQRARAGIAAGIAAPIVSWSLSAVVIMTWPGYDPISQSISSLAGAPLGWLQTLAFTVSAVLGAAWAFGLAGVLGSTARDRTLVRGLLLLQAGIILGFALLPTDPEGVPIDPGRATPPGRLLPVRADGAADPRGPRPGDAPRSSLASRCPADTPGSGPCDPRRGPGPGDPGWSAHAVARAARTDLRRHPIDLAAGRRVGRLASYAALTRDRSA